LGSVRLKRSKHGTTSTGLDVNEAKKRGKKEREAKRELGNDNQTGALRSRFGPDEQQQKKGKS